MKTLADFILGPKSQLNLSHLNIVKAKREYILNARLDVLKVDFHSVQFSERAEFCDRFLLKCVLSCRTNFIRYG